MRNSSTRSRGGGGGDEGGSQQKTVALQRLGATVSRGGSSGQARVAKRSRMVRTDRDLLCSETRKSFDEQPFLWNEEHGSQIGVG